MNEYTKLLCPKCGATQVDAYVTRCRVCRTDLPGKRGYTKSGLYLPEQASKAPEGQ